MIEKLNAFVVAKGTSATGKGTRMVQFIEFLKSKEFVFEEVKVDKKGKRVPVALAFPSLSLCFVGTYTKSNRSGLWSWTSMDYIHSSFGGADGAAKIIEQLRSEYRVICLEGEPMMLSNRWRPENIYHNGAGSLDLLYFTYPDSEREAYDARVIDRSGKAAGDSGWSRNLGYLKEIEKSSKEAIWVRDQGLLSMETRIYDYRYDSDLSVIGECVIDLVADEAEDITVEEFIEFCETYPMTRSIKDGTDPLKPKKANALW